MTEDRTPLEELDDDEGQASKWFANLQARAALAGAELLQVPSGGYILRRGASSVHCHWLAEISRAVGRLPGAGPC